MIASKGDSSAAFRVSEQTVYFFIKNTNGSWKFVQVPLTSEEMNQWSHVASSLRWKQYFCLCRRKRNGNHTECGKRSRNDLSAWYRILSGDTTSFFRISEEHPRLLSKALSKDDLDNGTYKADNEKTVLWYDFDNYSYNNIDTKATGVNVSTDALELKEAEGAQVSATIAPLLCKR